MSGNIDNSTISSITSQITTANTIATTALSEVIGNNSITAINKNNIENLENKLKALCTKLNNANIQNLPDLEAQEFFKEYTDFYSIEYNNKRIEYDFRHNDENYINLLTEIWDKWGQ